MRHDKLKFALTRKLCLALVVILYISSYAIWSSVAIAYAENHNMPGYYYVDTGNEFGDMIDRAISIFYRPLEFLDSRVFGSLSKGYPPLRKIG